MKLRKEHKMPSVFTMQRLHERNDTTGSVIPKKGEHRRKYIAATTIGKKEYFLHATKGYRAFTA